MADKPRFIQFDHPYIEQMKTNMRRHFVKTIDRLGVRQFEQVTSDYAVLVVDTHCPWNWTFDPLGFEGFPVAPSWEVRYALG